MYPPKLSLIFEIILAKVAKYKQLVPPQERNLCLLSETCVLVGAQVFLHLAAYAHFIAGKRQGFAATCHLNDKKINMLS
jgi:hypothetical protein